jgi:hypothetical protein
VKIGDIDKLSKIKAVFAYFNNGHVLDDIHMGTTWFI